MDTYYRNIFSTQLQGKESFDSFEGSLDNLIASIDDMIKEASISNQHVQDTLDGVMHYSTAKANMEKSMSMLNNLLYLIEYSKKLQ